MYCLIGEGYINRLLPTSLSLCTFRSEENSELKNSLINRAEDILNILNFSMQEITKNGENSPPRVRGSENPDTWSV